MQICPYPIAVMSFNRPDLLTEVLTSFKNQTVSVDESRIYLFQDGAQSRFTQVPADHSLQNECVRRFREILPRGQVLQSRVNLGVALNFDRAERLFFETLQADCSLFFEDDLVISPRYIEALLQLVDFALSEPLVSCVAAYGDHAASLECQRSNHRRIIPMTSNWGFALTRRQWLRQKTLIDGYLSIVRESEYSQRDERRIMDYFASLGFAPAGSSQDCAKEVADLVLGTTRIMCFPCFGYYIGREGFHHCTANLCDECRCGDTMLFDQATPQFDVPTQAQLNEWIDEKRRLSRDRLISSSEPRVADILLKTGAADYVNGLYRSLLGRFPDPQELDAWVSVIRSGNTLSEIAKGFVESAEFKLKFSASNQNALDCFIDSPPNYVDVEISAASFDQLIKRVRASWEALGRTRPHWSVLTNPIFLPDNIQANVLNFYQTGERSVRILEKAAARAGKEILSNWTCFELGCGVGRVTAYLAHRFSHVVAFDISHPHLMIARAYLRSKGTENVTLVQLKSLETLEKLEHFDVFYSIIVLQHNPPPLMYRMLELIFDKVRSGGYVYFQVPVAYPNYRFSIDEYMAAVRNEESEMEMHALPQTHLFRVLDEHGFRILDFQRDDWTGPGFHSVTVFAEKVR
jgi:SAM-dependent methyltransferase